MLIYYEIVNVIRLFVFICFYELVISNQFTHQKILIRDYLNKLGLFLYCRLACINLDLVQQNFQPESITIQRINYRKQGMVYISNSVNITIW